MLFLALPSQIPDKVYDYFFTFIYVERLSCLHYDSLNSKLVYSYIDLDLKRTTSSNTVN